jgi:RNA polymerase sigma-70 factor (ECF subfamily)
MDEPTDQDAESETTHDIPDNHPQPDEKALSHEMTEVIRKAMLRLPEQFRTSIVLREVEGLSYEEIAVITKTEMGTVKSRIARARSKLQELLKPYLENRTSPSEVSS